METRQSDGRGRVEEMLLRRCRAKITDRLVIGGKGLLTGGIATFLNTRRANKVEVDAGV